MHSRLFFSFFTICELAASETQPLPPQVTQAKEKHWGWGLTFLFIYLKKKKNRSHTFPIVLWWGGGRKDL